ncbi:MAG: hypothetical protein IJE78_03535 [Bacteroidaceae bacterium]|nr:hypothetical protein [Bacteroidaceae bacterium]
MKKLLSLFGVLIFIGCIQAHAEKRRVTMEHWQTSNVDGSTTVRRSLMRIPIDVYYDDDLRQIEIYGEEDMDVQIYLRDENGNTITYSSTINTILDVPDGYSGLLSIWIESENWIFTGKLLFDISQTN